MADSTRGPCVGVTAVILAGGAGTRLRSVVSDRQKVLAEVNGRPFLAYLLDQLLAARVARTVLCTGHLAAQVQTVFGSHWQGMTIDYSQENTPLGTGGALRLAATTVDTPDVLVLNGDSYCFLNLGDMLSDYRAHDRHPLIAVSHQSNTSRFGQVDLAADGVIIRFREKEAAGGEGWINAGVYAVDRESLLKIPADQPVSLEREVFPSWIGQLRGFPCHGAFLDIGTPESYGQAAAFLGMLPESVP